MVLVDRIDINLCINSIFSLPFLSNENGDAGVLFEFIIPCMNNIMYNWIGCKLIVLVTLLSSPPQCYNVKLVARSPSCSCSTAFVVWLPLSPPLFSYLLALRVCEGWLMIWIDRWPEHNSSFLLAWFALLLLWYININWFILKPHFGFVRTIVTRPPLSFFQKIELWLMIAIHVVAR